MNSKFLLRLTLDFICMSTSVCFTLLYYNYKTMPVRGFFCDDYSIKYPYHEKLLDRFKIIGCFYAVPMTFICLFEAIIFPWRMRSVNKIRYLMIIYKTFVIFTFGIFLTQSFVVYVKFTVGRLRPHFIQVCQPDVDCKQLENKFKYITEYSCTNNDKHLEWEARISFPSFQTVFATQSCLLVIIYLEAKLIWEGLNLIKRFVQLIIFTIALIIGLSSLRDYNNHASDVVAGFIIGAFFAFFIGYFMTDWFKLVKKQKDKTEILSN